MKARHIIDLISDDGKIIKTSIYNEEFKDMKEFEKEILRRFSKSNSTINIKEVTYESSLDKCVSEYKKLNTTKCFEEFKDEYHYPKMSRYSYRRVLEGKSTYISNRHSPYIADIFRFVAKRLDKTFLEVAYDLLNLEYLGRKTTLLDVILAEKNLEYKKFLKLIYNYAYDDGKNTEEYALDILNKVTTDLTEHRLYNLDLEGLKTYDDIMSAIKWEMEK